MLQSLPPVPCSQYWSEVVTIFSTITAENKHKSIGVTNTYAHHVLYISQTVHPCGALCFTLDEFVSQEKSSTVVSSRVAWGKSWRPHEESVWWAGCSYLVLEVSRSFDGLTLASYGLERLQRKNHFILPGLLIVYADPSQSNSCQLLFQSTSW